MSGFQFQAPLLSGDESLERLVGSSALGSLGAPGGGGGAGFGTRSREELELELEAVRGELTERKRELSDTLEAYQELQAMYDSRMGRGGDATIVRKQLQSQEAEWARERAELLTEVSRLKRQLQARTAAPVHHSAAVSSVSSAGELLTTFAEQFLTLEPDFESVAHIEGFRTIFGWCFASWASQELKHKIASGARALARGDMDVKQTLIFCGAHKAMLHICSEELSEEEARPSSAASSRVARQSNASLPLTSSSWADNGEDVARAGGGSALEDAVACLSNLACKHKPSRGAIAEAGGVQILLSVVSRSMDMAAQERACTALGNLACSAHVKVHIGNEGGGEVLVKACAAQRSDDIVIEAARALRNLANQSDSNCRKIASAGGVDVLGSLCDVSLHAGVVSQAVSALSNLAAESSTRGEMRQKLRWDAEWGTKQLAAHTKRFAKAQHLQHQQQSSSATPLNGSRSTSRRSTPSHLKSPATTPIRGEVDADLVLANLERSFASSHSPSHPRSRATSSRGVGAGGTPGSSRGAGGTPGRPLSAPFGSGARGRGVQI